MDRKFLDGLYERLNLVKKEHAEKLEIKVFNGGDCSSDIHDEKIRGLAMQMLIISDIIDDYLNYHGKPND